MINKIIITFHKLYKIKFRFDFPLPEKILLFDESHSSNLKEIIKKDFSSIVPFVLCNPHPNDRF